MAFTISISITGDEKDYTAAVQRAQQATNQLKTSAQGAGIIFDQYGKTIQSAAQQAERGLRSNAAAANNATIAYGKFRPAVALAASQVAGLGSVSGVASAALIALTAGTFGTGLALGGLALALGLVIPKIQQFKKESDKARAAQNFGLDVAGAEFLDPQIRQRPINEMQQALMQALDIERARGDAGKQIGIQLDAQAQKLIQQFPANEQFIKNTVERLKNEKNITIEIERRLKLSAEENDSANRLAEIQKRIGAGIRQTKAEDEEARRKVADEENESALRLAEIQGRVGAGRRATVAEDNAKLVESFALQKGLAEVEADRLEVLGLSNQAQAVRQQGIIQELESQRALNVELGKNTDLLDAQINLAQTRLSRVGAVTLDIGQHVAGTLNDILTAMISGTLKGVNASQAAAATLGRIATDLFSQVIRNKLSFETTLLTNMRGLAPQMQQAFASGGGFAAMASALDAQHGGGGISLGGGALSTGSGQGGFLSGIVRLFSGLFGGNTGGLSGFVPTLAGLAGPSLLTGGSSSNVFGAIFGSFSNPLGMINSFLQGAIPGIGALIGALIGLFMKPAAPFTKIQARVKTPFSFDPLSEEFIAATFGAKATQSVGISGSANKEISSAVVKALTEQANVWTDVLNIFPEFVHDRMIPTLAAANRTLKAFLREPFKFSPGGSKGIEEELKDFMRSTAPRIAFYSLRGTIGAGLAALLSESGFGALAGAALAQFSPVTPAQAAAARGKFTDLRTVPGFKLGGKKQQDPFRQALSEFIGIGAGLSEISPAGIVPFVTEEDRRLIEGGIQRVLATRSSKKFTAAFQGFKQDAGPVLEFLQQAVQQSQQLMGRGISAAFEAASGDIAVWDFQRTVGLGVQQMVQEGLAGAFIASAQFNDILAPIQQLIRQTIQTSTETGLPPDFAAFRAALLPRVEELSSRADLLNEILRELQRNGLDLRNIFGKFTGFRAGPFIINIDHVREDEDPADLARRIFGHLNGLLAPPTV